MFIRCNYKIAIMWLSKTVLYDRLRTRDVNNNFNGNNYKNVTALFSKAVLQNRLRIAVVETCFSHPICLFHGNT